MPAVAVPTIRADLGLTTGTAAWVMSGYVLGYAGFTLLGGRAAGLLGRRRMFLAWLGVFLVFSMLGGFATDGWMLIVARFVTGVAAAFMTPAALSIITTSYPEGPQRDKALLVFAGVGAGGFSLGLVTRHPKRERTAAPAVPEEPQISVAHSTSARRVECGRTGNQRGSRADGSRRRTPLSTAWEPRASRVRNPSPDRWPR